MKAILDYAKTAVSGAIIGLYVVLAAQHLGPWGIGMEYVGEAAGALLAITCVCLTRKQKPV